MVRVATGWAHVPYLPLIYVFTRRRGANTAHTQMGRPTHEAPTREYTHYFGLPGAGRRKDLSRRFAGLPDLPPSLGTRGHPAMGSHGPGLERVQWREVADESSDAKLRLVKSNARYAN